MHWALGELLDDFFIPKVESDHEISIRVYPRGAICSESTCVEQVLLDELDIATISAGNMGAFGSTFDLLNLPYLFKDQAAASEVLNDWLKDELAESARQEMGIRVLAITPGGGFRNIVNTQRPVELPQDLEGLKMRTTKSPIELGLISAWGASVVPYDWALLYEGLQAGVVQGMYLQDVFMGVAGLASVVNYITRTEATYSAHILLMSEARFQRLSPKQQNLLLDAGRNVERMAEQYYDAWIKAGIASLEDKLHITALSPDQRSKWESQALSAWVQFDGLYSQERVKRILEYQQRYQFIEDLRKVGAL